jgi:hypothetical protein
MGGSIATLIRFFRLGVATLGLQYLKGPYRKKVSQTICVGEAGQ